MFGPVTFRELLDDELLAYNDPGYAIPAASRIMHALKVSIN
jgi:hypothetical protein